MIKISCHALCCASFPYISLWYRYEQAKIEISTPLFALLIDHFLGTEEGAEENVATGNRGAFSDCAINANQKSQGEPVVPATTPSYTT